VRARLIALIHGLDDALRTDLRNGIPLALKVALRLARTPRDRFVALTAGLLYGTRRWNRPIRLDLVFAGVAATFVVPDFAGFKVLGEVLLYGNYEGEVDPAPRSVLDLGANIGASALFFRARFPDARITCVEASPTVVRTLRANVAGLDVEVLHAAVAAQPGTITFYESDDTWAGSTSVTSDRPVEVEAVTLDDLLARTGADLVKIDVEGAEFDVLPSATRLADAATYMGEIHATPADPRTRAILDRFADATTEDCGGVTLFTGRF
jgi:FkbM family methyltransferase